MNFGSNMYRLGRLRKSNVILLSVTNTDEKS